MHYLEWGTVEIGGFVHLYTPVRLCLGCTSLASIRRLLYVEKNGIWLGIFPSTNLTESLAGRDDVSRGVHLVSVL